MDENFSPQSQSPSPGATASERYRRTAAATRAAASSTSASVVVRAKLKRRAECSTSSGTPIARSTGDGKSDPLEQADPALAATPAKSRAINRPSAAQPGN